MITYRSDVRPDATAVAELYRSSPLHRPVDDVARIARMYDGSTVVLSAWDGGRLVAILRGWTDGAYDGYICDLAVHPEYQKLGIGRQMLRRTHAFDPRIQWILIASKLAHDYYLHVGWQRIRNGWYWPREQ